MPSAVDILQAVALFAGAILLIFVVRARRRGKIAHDETYAAENVCEHLKPALELLKSRGHGVYRVGQLGPDMPLEIHLLPAFDPAAIQKELDLQPPVYLSERNVLFCKDDWCEIHPVK